MEGITRALTEVRPNFPIVVRRSGPYEKEGLEVLRKAARDHGLDMRIHGKELPMTESARLMVEAANKFAN
jgi:citryl-CoA synthetase large subunit